MAIQPILAADFIEILMKGIPVILFVLWLVGQALSERQKQQPPKQVARQPRPNPPPQAQREATDIEDEIDAFLRRAAEKKERPQQQRQQASREETVILVPPKQERRRPQPASRPAETRRPEAPARSRGGTPLGKPLTQQTVAARETPPRPRSATAPPAGTTTQPTAPQESSVGGSALRSMPLSQLSLNRADPESRESEGMPIHAQTVLGHQLGRLEHRATEPTRRESATPIVQSVVEMLKTPQGVQQMIVLNEILRRPEI